MMQATLSKNDLQKALTLVISLTERKSPMPVLSNVLVTCSGESLSLSATDLEVATVTRIAASVERNGGIAVGGRVFADIVRELPEGNVVISVKDRARLEVKSGKSVFHINGVSPDEYPSLNGIGLEASTKIEVSLFKAMIDGTVYACSTDETRFVLNGVCIEASPEKKDSMQLRMVATDGHRLALSSRKILKGKLSERIIVSRRGLQEVKKLLDVEARNDVGFDINEGFFIIEGSDTKIASRLIDGEFPDYSGVVPTTEGVIARIKAKELYHTIKRSSVVLTDKTKKLELTFSPGALRVRGVSSELGEAEESIDVDYSGEVIKIGFNARYLLEALSSLGEERKICFGIHGEYGPAKIWSEGDESAYAVIMPMRLE